LYFNCIGWNVTVCRIFFVKVEFIIRYLKTFCVYDAVIYDNDSTIIGLGYYDLLIFLVMFNAVFRIVENVLCYYKFGNVICILSSKSLSAAEQFI